jgi:hypothetical protein
MQRHGNGPLSFSNENCFLFKLEASQKDQFQMNMLHNPIFTPKLEINNLQKKDWVLLNVLFNIRI